MRTKKLISILIAVAFVFVTVFSIVAMFSTKKVEVTFAVDVDTDTVAVQRELDKFLGSNLLFLDVEAVEKQMQGFHYMKILSVDKVYPNVLKVNIEERREIYEIANNGTIYVTTEDGFVLRTFTDNGVENDRDLIRLELSGVEVLDATLGKTISTSADDVLQAVFKMATKVQLTNCIKYVNVRKTLLMQDAEFYTYTGVKIIVREILDDGVGKIEEAFKKYDEVASDYEKTFRTIEVFRLTETGEIIAQWTNN